MQATGNIMAVMDAMGHEHVDTLRIYNHPELQQIPGGDEQNGMRLCSRIATKLPQSVQKTCREIVVLSANGIKLVALPGIEPGFED